MATDNEAAEILRKKFDVFPFQIKEEIKLREGKHGEKGDLVLIKDSEGRPVAIIKLMGEDALYRGEPRICITLPNDRFVQVATGLHEATVIPGKLSSNTIKKFY